MYNRDNARDSRLLSVGFAGSLVASRVQALTAFARKEVSVGREAGEFDCFAGAYHQPPSNAHRQGRPAKVGVKKGVLSGRLDDVDARREAVPLRTDHFEMLRPEAELEGATADGVLDGILASVPVPR